MFWGLFNHRPPQRAPVNRPKVIGKGNHQTNLHLPGIEDSGGLRILKQSDWPYIRGLEEQNAITYIGILRLGNKIVYRYYLSPPE